MISFLLILTWTHSILWCLTSRASFNNTRALLEFRFRNMYIFCILKLWMVILINISLVAGCWIKRLSSSISCTRSVLNLLSCVKGLKYHINTFSSYQWGLGICFDSVMALPGSLQLSHGLGLCRNLGCSKHSVRNFSTILYSLCNVHYFITSFSPSYHFIVYRGPREMASYIYLWQVLHILLRYVLKI